MKALARTRRFPWLIVATAIPLACAGWLGIARCDELIGGSGRGLRLQMIWSGLAAAAMLAATIPNYRVHRPSLPEVPLS